MSPAQFDDRAQSGGTKPFDYIVVGSGSGGAVVASRLSEDPRVSVLLLEAGSDDVPDEIAIPLAFSTLFKTAWDWNYQTTPQKFLGGRRAYWPRAKALGGCTTMNAMIYIRGNALDYDTWRDDYGATGWGYDDVLPYFCKSEDNARLGGRYHASGGPLRVEDRRYDHELTHAFLEASSAVGLKRTDDFNGAEQEGAGLYQVTQRAGRRWSVADGFLRPFADRPNLTIVTEAFAERVDFDGTRAIGVTYTRHGERIQARAEAEVVLAAGAVNTPQLLMLSGVGPGAHLREHGISLVADSPGVGQNLHDHPVAGFLVRTRGTTDVAEMIGVKNLLRWKLRGDGPLASNVAESGAFFASDDALPAPDIQLHVAPTGFYDNGMHESVHRSLVVAPTLVDVHSRGALRLRSADPRFAPEIDPAYFDDQRDLDALVRAFDVVSEILHASPLAGFVDRAWRPASLRPSRDQIVEGIAELGQTLYHPVGTCAMGTHDDAVVDPQLRVNGVEGLRIADASVMPKVPRGNTNAPAIMVGEKAADLIRGAA